VLVSVIVVSWNRRRDTVAALASVAAQSYRPVEVVVVDAASTDGSPESIRAHHSYARLVELERNFGVGGNRNAGIRAAQGDLLFFLDNDAELEAHTLTELVSLFACNPRLGAAGCRVMDGSGNVLDRASWIYPFTPEKAALKSFFTYTFAGGASAIRRQAIEDVGGFCESFFFAREEEELCLRMLDRGWKVAYLGRARVRHRGSAAVRTPKARKLALDLRNMLWITWRYFPAIAAFRLTALRLATYAVRALRCRMPRAALSGFAEALAGLRPVLASRRPIRKDVYNEYCVLNPLSRVFPSRRTEPLLLPDDDRRTA
jgi:GT2 family glycosyltransferase